MFNYMTIIIMSGTNTNIHVPVKLFNIEHHITISRCVIALGSCTRATRASLIPNPINVITGGLRPGTKRGLRVVEVTVIQDAWI